MIEYLTTGVIVLLLYAAVIGVLILMGGEDEIAKMATNERDGKALSDSEVLQDGCIKPDGDCARCCASEYCSAIFTKGARAKDGND